MKNKKVFYLEPTEKNLKMIFQDMASSTKLKVRANSREQKDTPSVVEVLQQLMTTGTAFTYPEAEINLSEYPLSPVKALQVTVSSMETEDLRALHQIHNQISKVN